MESCRYKIIRMIKSRRIKNPYNNECRIANPTQLTTTRISATTGGDYHEMNITNIEYPSGHYGKGYFEAFVIDEDGEDEGIERTFKISRMDFITPSDIDDDEDDDE